MQALQRNKVGVQEAKLYVLLSLLRLLLQFRYLK